MMVVHINIDVPPHYTSYKFCPNVTQLYLIKGISAPGNGKEVVDGINVIAKRYMYKLMSTVQLPRSKYLIHRV